MLYDVGLMGIRTVPPWTFPPPPRQVRDRLGLGLGLLTGGQLSTVELSCTRLRIDFAWKCALKIESWKIETFTDFVLLGEFSPDNSHPVNNPNHNPNPGWELSGGNFSGGDCPDTRLCQLLFKTIINSYLFSWFFSYTLYFHKNITPSLDPVANRSAPNEQDVTSA